MNRNYRCVIPWLLKNHRSKYNWLRLWDIWSQMNYYYYLSLDSSESSLRGMKALKNSIGIPSKSHALKLEVDGIHSFMEIFVVGRCYFTLGNYHLWYHCLFPEKHRNNGLKKVCWSIQYHLYSQNSIQWYYD